MDVAFVGPAVAVAACVLSNVVTFLVIHRAAELRNENRFTKLEASVESMAAIQRAEMTEIARKECAHLRRNLDGIFDEWRRQHANLESWAREHEKAKHYKSESE